jgi:uncharacterized protein (TIGR03083 family)
MARGPAPPAPRAPRRRELQPDRYHSPPMTISRDELLAIARHERDALGRTVQYTPPERWEEDSPCEGWRVKDVLAHLAANDVAVAALVAEETPTELEDFRKELADKPFTRDGWNEWSVQRRPETSAVSLAMEWGRAADLFLSRASQASPRDWDEREIAWVAGPLRLKYLVQVRVSEWWVHGEDIREGAALPPRVQHWPVYAVNDLAVRLIPYSLSTQGQSFPGKSVRVDLEGVGGGTWMQGLDPRGAVPAGEKPDAIIEGQGYAFASVAGGRADPEVCLYEGLLLTGGDVRLAETVLRSLRSSP